MNPPARPFLRLLRCIHTPIIGREPTSHHPPNEGTSPARPASLPPMSEAATPADELLPLRIRTIRQAAGLTQQACARAAGCSVTTWRGWERGRQAPRPWNLERIARALSAPVAALLVPDGWRALELRLQPGTVERIRAGGLPVARELAELYASSLPELLLAACRVPARPPAHDGRGRPRRTRAQVLAGIAAAEAARAAARAREAGGGGDSAREMSLHGSRAHQSGSEAVSTLLTAED